MTKVKLLSIAVVVLLLLNIGTLAMAFVGKPGHHGPPREGPKAMIIERLHLDAEQVKVYEGLIEMHQVSINEKEAKMMAARSALYHDLKQPNAASRDSLLASIAGLQREIETTHLAHFGDIRTLCRADQLADFNALSEDLADFFSRGKGGPPKGRK